ncbi:glycosyltransferase family 2 protein [Winogradskyella sp.]|uniref:glycosyltransferase family 2 protein n=1 Tax=Winogradskyella sp. TaxID=1883156 RepID=UPI0035C78C4D
MIQPLISIIIPSYNRANLIGETLDSIIAQTYQKWECIIIDDGSTDNSTEVIGKYTNIDNRIQFYKRPKTKPKGANACRNYGFELSKGEYVNWLDSDDIFHRDKLKLQLSNIIEEKAPFSICKSYVFENHINEDDLQLKSSKVKTNDSFNDFISKQIIIPIQAPVFKKSFLIENNFYFDERLQAGQEWEFFARILFKFPNYGTVNTALDYIRSHDNNISNHGSEEKYWHYYMARVYFEEKIGITLSKKSQDILDRFYLFILKRFIRKRKFRNSIKVYFSKINKIKKLSLKDKVYLFIGLVSNGLFNKGDKFLGKVSLYN